MGTLYVGLKFLLKFTSSWGDGLLFLSGVSMGDTVRCSVLKKGTTYLKLKELGIQKVTTQFPHFDFRVPTSQISPKKSPFSPSTIFTKIANSHFQQILDGHNQITSVSFITTKNILWKCMHQIFKMGENWLFVGEIWLGETSFKKWGKMGPHKNWWLFYLVITFLI